MERTEARIQQECVQFFRNTYGLNHHDPQYLMMSIPNEGMNIVEQMKKKSTGMLKGASDTIIVLKGKVIWCEFKDAKGRQKPEQIKFEQKVTALRHEYWLVRSLEEFQIKVWEEFGILSKDF